MTRETPNTTHLKCSTLSIETTYRIVCIQVLSERLSDTVRKKIVQYAGPLSVPCYTPLNRSSFSHQTHSKLKIHVTRNQNSATYKIKSGQYGNTCFIPAGIGKGNRRDE